MYVPCGEDTNITTELVVEIGPEKNSAASFSSVIQFSISFLFFCFPRNL